MLKELPELIAEVHKDYFDAGASIATANSYTLRRDRLARFNMEHEFEALNRAACEIAVKTRDGFGDGRVAGSIGLTGGSYQPEIAPPAEVAAEIFHEIASVQSAYVDLFLLETMSAVEQARGALMGVSTSGKPVWLAISVLDDDGSRLRSGESVLDILPLLNELPVEALLVNWSHSANTPLGVYANGFTRIEKAFQKPGASVDVL